MWTLSWQLEPGLEAFQGRIKSCCRRVRVGEICKGWGWLNQGLVRHGGKSAANEGANENMSSVFHPRHFRMGCSVFRSFEPVEWGEVDGRAAISAQVSAKQEHFWSCLLCFGENQIPGVPQRKTDFSALVLFIL